MIRQCAHIKRAMRSRMGPPVPRLPRTRMGHPDVSAVPLRYSSRAASFLHPSDRSCHRLRLGERGTAGFGRVCRWHR